MSSSSKIILLQSSDGEKFEVEEAVALKSETIKFMIEDECVDTVIPVANVTGKILAMVIKYCKHHVENKKTVDEDDIKAFDDNFVKVEKGTLFNLILAANYLNIKDLLDITCQVVADNIKNMTPEEVRKTFNTFNIKNDFTPEEEAEIGKDNAWAFEGI